VKTNRPIVGTILVLLLVVSVSPAPADRGELQIEIQNLPDKLLLTNNETETDVVGGASVFGGLKHLDLYLILDASKSLWRTDPDDYRLKGATALIRALPEKSDIRIGVVAFDSKAMLISPLTADHEAVVERLQTVPRDGGTNLHDGIRMALDGFSKDARPETAQIALLFTDGKSDRVKAIEAAEEARDQGAVLHSLLLLDRDKSADLLQTIARTTGGSFLYVDDPEDLPRAFLDLKTTGVEHVKLSVDGGPPIDTEFVTGTFNGLVPLKPGVNVVTATATDLDGEQVSAQVEITVTGPLRVAIASPIDGMLFTRHEKLVDVEINASVFSTPTEALRQTFPTLGVENVELHVGGLPPIPTDYEDGQFKARVPLVLQANRIRASATSFDGRTAETAIDVVVRPPGCSELSVAAMRDGRPAISLNDRGLEVIFDASGSMWGQIDGTAKITIAKETVRDVMTGFPEDFFTALRVYGHQYPRQQHNCEDSELLIPLATGNADVIRHVIEGFKPKGQTPLGYSVEQLPADFGNFEGQRAVVLITDGIESCDGDAVAAAQGFQEEGKQRPIHVIGFGFEIGQEEALQSLRSIAETTGGKFITAGDAGELRRALSETAGTTFSIWRDTVHVTSGTLGAAERFQLSAGDYTLRLHSEPLREFVFAMGAEESVALTLAREGDSVSTRVARQPGSYFLCP